MTADERIRPEAGGDDGFLRAQTGKGLLRFITCGSVDDGKSTLIGRLLYDSRLILDDQLKSLESESRRTGTVKDGLDFALLVDGLQAEREQGITIDVAYRYFATNKRRFIVADTPGHEQYTRNMATGASTAKLAVILVDARKGVLLQTRRHTFIASLLGIRDIVLAVNKMDLVDFDPQVFARIDADYRCFAEGLGLTRITAIPLSALDGDNIVEPSTRTPWYAGPTLLRHLEEVEIPDVGSDGPFRFPVQLVNRPDPDFRGLSGTVAGGRVRPGDEVVVLPSGRGATIARIVTFDGDLDEAVSGQAVTLTLSEDVDAGRGDLIASATAPAQVTDQFAAYLVWMSDTRMLPERQYLLKTGTRTVPAAITELKHRINVETLDHVAAKTLALNEIGFCNFSVDHPIAFDPYGENRNTGSFILIDRFTFETVGAGVIAFGLRRASNLTWQKLLIDKQARARLNQQKPCILWFTGLSGAGKSTIANLVEQKLHTINCHSYLLDGDNVRHGLNRDLGFTDEDRVENIRRVAEAAALFVDAGIIVLVSFISPFANERLMARNLVEPEEFLEIFIDTSLEECERRDPKGLYRKARSKQIMNFTGIDSPYEPPKAPDIAIRTAEMQPHQAADYIIEQLRLLGKI